MVQIGIHQWELSKPTCGQNFVCSFKEVSKDFGSLDFPPVSPLLAASARILSDFLMQSSWEAKDAKEGRKQVLGPSEKRKKAFQGLLGPLRPKECF